MEKLINNPNLAQHVGKQILKCLDNESLLSCRQVNSSMKQMVDEPRFWLKKLSCDEEFPLDEWRKLVELAENTDLEKNVTKCLIKLHKIRGNFRRKDIQVPIYFTSLANRISTVDSYTNS